MSDTSLPGMNVSIRVEGSGLPSGGSAGDVLTRSESGTMWTNLESSIETMVLEMLANADVLPVTADESGAVLTDESGAILLND